MCDSCQTCDNHAQGYAPGEAHPKFARMENKGIRGEVDVSDSGEQRA